MSQIALPQPSSAKPSTRALPDLNAETYPFGMVEELLEQTANFSIFATPVAGHSSRASLNAKNQDDWFNLNGGYGLECVSNVSPFESVSRVRGESLEVSQNVGEATGLFRCLCMFSPPDFRWNPHQSPPPWIFDPWRSQYFVMQECELSFGEHHVCKFYGIGRTFPLTICRRPILMMGGVANLTNGTGKFLGRTGTLVCSGTITPELGFRGNINLRIRDEEKTLVSESDLLPLAAVPDPDPRETFIELRLIKKNQHVKTTFGPPDERGQPSLITPSEMRSVRYSYDVGHRGPRTHMSSEQVLGPMEATVRFDISATPGTADAPVPFSTEETYTFRNSRGATIGQIYCGVAEGQSFDLKFSEAPGQSGVRFAGFGPITGGTGIFTQVRGMLTVNSLIGISPHALSLMHALHIVDPRRRFRPSV